MFVIIDKFYLLRLFGDEFLNMIFVVLIGYLSNVWRFERFKKE